ncbi:hypothetical protein CRYUN_Cryun20dG0086400 [Craigia yunnanensis]
MGGIGVVIRNGDETVIGAYVGRRLGLVCPFIVEASAAICSILLAQQMGFYNVENEGDALGVIKKIQEKEADMSPIGVLIEEARVRKSLQFCKFTHIGRLGNMVAHMLAKHGLELEEDRFWMEDCPDFVKDFILNDFSVLS